ncbi:MAG: Verru_Chthon cassette protein C [Chthoniobacteraceae bacterium]
MSRSCHPARAFTLVEMMISMVILTMILIVVSSIANQTSRTWQFTTSKIQEFSAAQNSFDTITRLLSQATLNTYWDYVDAGGNTRTSANASTFVPSAYSRQSELRFVGDLTANLAPNASASRPLYAVFFQAPLGYSESGNSTGVQLKGLDKLLNSCGFFVEFNSDTAFKPSFLSSVASIKPRYRFRLMEYIEPSNTLSIYNYTSGSSTYSGYDWFANAFSGASAPVHVLAENIIALIILPKWSVEQDSTGASLAPNYTYHSADSTNTTTRNQLPPVVQVTMVALDEPSAIKLASQNGTAMPADLFTTGQFTKAAQFSEDLQTLESTLSQKKLNYRVFTTNVTLRASKWGNNR